MISPEMKLNNAEQNVMSIMLYEIDSTIRRNDNETMLEIFYTILLPDGTAYNGELYVQEDAWELDYECENLGELKLSNIVLVLNTLSERHHLWCFDGCGYFPLNSKVKKVVLYSQAGNLSEDSVKHLNNHYFLVPFSQGTTNG